MKPLKNVTLTLLLIISILPLSCGKKSQDIEVAGSFKNGVYLNTYLNFEISVPEGWRIVSESEHNKNYLEALDLLLDEKSTKELLKRISEMRSQKTAYLLGAELKKEEPEQSLSYIGVSSVSIKHLKGNRTARNFNMISKKTSKKLNLETIKYLYPKKSKAHAKSIHSGIKFDVLEGIIQIKNLELNFTQYVTVLKNQFLIINIGSLDEINPLDPNEIMQTIKIKGEA